MASPSQPAGTSKGASDNVGSEQESEVVTQIQMAGLTVLMIKKKDQVIYKLPDHMSVQSLGKEQRERLLAEINLLHHQQTTAQALAATQAQTQQVQLAQAQAALALARAQVQRAPMSQGGAPLVSSAVADGTFRSSDMSADTSLRTSSPSAQSTPGDTTSAQNNPKTTRRYNKTGKYSKKRQSQQHISDRALGSRLAVSDPTLNSSSSMSSIRPSLVFDNTSLKNFQVLEPSVSSSSSSTTTPAIATVGGSYGSSTLPTAKSGSETKSVLQPWFLQLQLHELQLSGLPTLDQKRQFKLLSEWRQAQQSLEVQLSSTTTFREHEQTVLRVLAHGKPVDIKTQNLAKQNRVEAEKSLERLQSLVNQKEMGFREQHPLAYQQLVQSQKILLQQQQQQQEARGPISSITSANAQSGTITSASSSSNTKSTTETPLSVIPKTVEDRLQQQIAEHHSKVRSEMAKELRQIHQQLGRQDHVRKRFTDLNDAIERLLPYHVFQHPPQDLEMHASRRPAEQEELNASTIQIHRRKYNLIRQYHRLLKARAIGGRVPICPLSHTTVSPTLSTPSVSYSSPRSASNALDLLTLRCVVEAEQAEHGVLSRQHASVLLQAKVVGDELEKRQAQLLQQRRTEAAMIEHQQRLMLDRQRQEEVQRLILEQEKERQRTAKESQDVHKEQTREQQDAMQRTMMIEQLRKMQEAQQSSHGSQNLANQDLEQLQQLLQQEMGVKPREGDDAVREERSQLEKERELQRLQHQLELEKQMSLKQDQQEQELRKQQQEQQPDVKSHHHQHHQHLQLQMLAAQSFAESAASASSSFNPGSPATPVQPEDASNSSLSSPMTSSASSPRSNN